MKSQTEYNPHLDFSEEGVRACVGLIHTLERFNIIPYLGGFATYSRLRKYWVDNEISN